MIFTQTQIFSSSCLLLHPKINESNSFSTSKAINKIIVPYYLQTNSTDRIPRFSDSIRAQNSPKPNQEYKTRFKFYWIIKKPFLYVSVSYKNLFQNKVQKSHKKVMWCWSYEISHITSIRGNQGLRSWVAIGGGKDAYLKKFSPKKI